MPFVTPKAAQGFSFHSDVCKYIFVFFQQLDVGPRPDSLKSGITWMELFFLFLLRGGPLHLLTLRQEPFLPPLKQYLSAFYSAAKIVF